MAKEMGLKPEEQALFEKFMARMTALLRAEITWEKLKAPTISLYMTHFSEQDLGDMPTVYRSASGQSMLKIMPEISKVSMMMGQDMMKTLLPQIQQLLQELGAELQVQRKAAKAAKASEPVTAPGAEG